MTGKAPQYSERTGQAKPQWHRMTAVEVLQRLESNPLRGLTTGEARRRLCVHGPNRLPEKAGTPLWAVFAGQFRDLMVLILLGATVLSYLLGEVVDAIAIAAIVLLNAVLGSVQEFRAERSLAALKRISAPRARVLRDGRVVEIPSAEVVPGDILLLASGDRVAADVRLIEAVAMEADEAALTGESVPVAKAAADPVAMPGAYDGRHGASGPPAGQAGDTLGDRPNMAYQGTVITRGYGRGVVVATGMNTEVGGIAGMMEAAEHEATPLQRRLDQLGRYLVSGCLVVSAAVAAGGVLRGEKPYEMLMSGVSLAVAAIPEGLPAVVTIVLALGVQRMLRSNAIVRRLPAVEALGCVTVICSDKTGTMTRNEMTVRAVYAGGRLYSVGGEGYRPEGRITHDGRPVAPSLLSLEARPPHELALTLAGGAVCNNAALIEPARGEGGRRLVEGDPTEGALLVLAAKAGLDPAELAGRFPRLGEVPFESYRQLMTVITRTPEGGRLAFVKGAPEKVLGLCAHILEDGRVRPLTAADRRRIMEINADLAGRALRVLAFACRSLPDHLAPAPELVAAGAGAGSRGTGGGFAQGPGAPADAGMDWFKLADDVERALTFTGLVGMIDPPRPEVREAVARCRRAGIRVVMVTGDHALTAQAVAKELGLAPDGGNVVTGHDLERLTEEELAKRAGDVSVFARVSPAHKLHIVRALKHSGERVAMTGDGVNDAPALKEADIGVAMGRGGTEVAKEAADMVLADDNFATIVAAVEQGRAIYDNIRKFIRYLLSCNTGEVLVMFLATLLGWPLPLLPIQILLVNLITDGLPAVALGVDPPEGGIMSRPPRPPSESVFARGLWQRILIRGLTIALTTLGAFALAVITTGDLDHGRTVAMAVLCISQLAFAFECRSETRGPFEAGIFGNRVLLGAVTVSLSVLLAVIHVPALRAAFHATPLTPLDWLLVLAAACVSSLLTALPRLLGRSAAQIDRRGRDATI